MKRTAKPRKKSTGRTPGRRERNKEKTRLEILEAALELFSRKGFFNTTTREISRKAKIAEGTLFNYFKTKEDLALYFFERELAGLEDWHRTQKRLADAPLSEILFAIINRHLERLSPYEEFVGAVYLRSLLPRSKLNFLSLDAQELNVRYLRFMQRVLVDAEEKGELPAMGEMGVYAVGLFHLAIITYWLQDASPGKEKTLALLDRSLKLGGSLLKKGGWDW